MANLSISREGIHQALAGLSYKENSKKYKVISAINAYYNSEKQVSEISFIDTDTLIKTIWGLEKTPAQIKSKRRNFSSLKSSINADLKKLADNGKNPENIRITDANTFDMSEEAKADLLNSFSNALNIDNIDIDQAGSILNSLTDFIDNYNSENGEDEKSEDLVSQIQNILDKLANNTLPDIDETKKDGKEKFDTTGSGKEGIGQPKLEETEEVDDIEEVVLDEDEEVEEVDALDDDVEEIVLDEDEEIEEVDDIEDDIEEIELEEDEEIDDIEEDDVEEIEIDENEELEQTEGLTQDEIKALEEFNEKKKLAEQFDDKLSDADKKFNTYVIVPAGEYTIGTKKTLKASLELQKFDMPKVFIGKYPITNALFEAFVEETGYITTAEKFGFGNVVFGKFKKDGKTSLWKKNSGSTTIEKAFWYQPDGPGSSIHGKKSHPIVQVSVDDAFAFASWIGRRLPTEAEWEASARTDLGYKYPWGNTWEENACNIEKNGAGSTTEVDYYSDYENEFKISDLLGNVMEWTSDIEAPPIKIKKKQKYHVAKGGGWNAKDNLTFSSRALFKPGFTSNIIGFRCVSEIFQ